MVPGSAVIPWDVAELLGLPRDGRESCPISEVIQRAVGLEVERLGWVGDVRVHPLLILFLALVATPLIQIAGSPSVSIVRDVRRAMADEEAKKTDEPDEPDESGAP
jgi:hypothetical protein